MGKSVILLGATGLTGRAFLKKLLQDDRYDSVLVFGRNSCGLNHPKLNEIITDLFQLEEHQEQFRADTVFCCVGTTKAKTKNRENYEKIDKGIPVTAALLCEKNNIETFMVVSALGANPKSRIFYNRVKGKMEKEVLKKDIPRTYILQPSLIKDKRDESRLGEKLAQMAMNFLKPLMLGDLQKYKPISVQEITDCMLWLDNNNTESGRIPSDKMIEISVMQ